MNVIRKFLLILEPIFILVALIGAALWIREPSGNYEPTIVLFSTLSVLSEIGRRYIKSKVTTQSEEQSFNHEESVELVDKTQTNKDKEFAPLIESSTVFFHDRFTSCFPGVRGIKWFDYKEAMKKLAVFLREPLIFKVDNGDRRPIWYWRDGNFNISKFSKLDRHTVLIDIMEFRVRRIAAINTSLYYQSFVYLETEAMKPTGLYDRADEEVEKSKKHFGYVSEEYGLYKGKHKITRAEYDDNAATINGKLVELGKDVELRMRFITPYNLIIAPHGSPINNNLFDDTLKKYMNDILEERSSLDELLGKIVTLPRKDLE